MPISSQNLFAQTRLTYLAGACSPEHIEWITREGGCLEVIREDQAAGKIRFIGFSTHAMTPIIVSAIETDIFDYVNLHYQVHMCSYFINV